MPKKLLSVIHKLLPYNYCQFDEGPRGPKLNWDCINEVSKCDTCNIMTSQQIHRVWIISKSTHIHSTTDYEVVVRPKSPFHFAASLEPEKNI